MLTIPQDLDQKIAENLRCLHADPNESTVCFNFVQALFLDQRIYDLQDENVLDDAWELELATYNDVTTLPDYIYDFVHSHPDPLVRRGWLTFCRQTHCTILKSSVRQFLKDEDVATKETAQNLFYDLEEAQRQRQEVPEAGDMDVAQAKQILGDHLFSAEAKRKAIDRVWSLEEYMLLSDQEKDVYNQQCQPILAEMMPLMLENFMNPFVGDGFFKLHFCIVMRRAEPASEALIEQEKDRLLNWWWKDATLCFSYGLINAPIERQDECVKFVRDVLDTDFYRLGKLIIRKQLNSTYSSTTRHDHV